jgi:hypothetical protein
LLISNDSRNRNVSCPYLERCICASLRLGKAALSDENAPRVMCHGAVPVRVNAHMIRRPGGYVLTPRCLVILSLVAWSLSVSAQQSSLTDEEVSTAIRLGQQGKLFSVRVGGIFDRGTCCDVIIEGPIARVSAAARENRGLSSR